MGNVCRKLDQQHSRELRPIVPGKVYGSKVLYKLVVSWLIQSKLVGGERKSLIRKVDILEKLLIDLVSEINYNKIILKLIAIVYESKSYIFFDLI